jgi:hypothetical protein
VASRALSADPEKRFMSAAALAADVRRIAGPKLAAPVRVAAFVRAAFGDRVQARRAELERGEVRVREVSGVLEPAPESVDVSVDLEPTTATISTAPTPIPPPLQESLAKGPAAPPPLVARVAPKPPALPNMRPRQPTLSGVAPPASLPEPAEGQGTPIVVPPDPPPPPRASPRAFVAPPTPLVAFEVPAAARISTDIAAALQVPPVAEVSAPAPVPPVLPIPVATPLTPAPPFVASVDEPGPPRKPRRALVVALLAGPIVFGMALVVWWLMARSPTQVASPSTPPEPQPTFSAAAIAPTSTPPAGTTTTPPAGAAATVQVAPTEISSPRAPTAVATASPTTAPPATPPAVTATPPWTPPPGYTPPPVVRPNKTHKYEPEGI